MGNLYGAYKVLPEKEKEVDEEMRAYGKRQQQNKFYIF
jgi:hypothetical protein